MWSFSSNILLSKDSHACTQMNWSISLIKWFLQDGPTPGSLRKGYSNAHSKVESEYGKQVSLFNSFENSSAENVRLMVSRLWCELGIQTQGRTRELI